MTARFEVREYDGMGRRGELTVPRADTTVETPVLMPVVNPHVQTLDPATIESAYGADILITNSYVLHGSEDLREPALEQGLHELLGFSGVIVTDSGSFQLAEYGDIDVDTREIVQFQQAIGSDIGTPVDIPTPPDVDHERAATEQATTQERLELASGLDTGEMLLNAPVQGSTHLDLRERAAREACNTGLDIFPIGAVVPLMKEYRFADLVEVVLASKRGLGADAPVHLFGAGHPMMFALGAATGCDLFDSAAYALYARDDRYLTVRGTEHLEELAYFPCECPVCTDHTPADLRGTDERHRQALLAEHNLAVSFGELRRVRQAIRRGNLFELLETRARGHPAVLDGYRRLLEHGEQLRATDPVSKDAFFYLSGDSARRPEVVRHHERLARLDAPAELVVTAGSPVEHFEASWHLRPPFGPVPPGLADAYPLTAETPDRLDSQAYQAAARGVRRLVETSPDSDVTLFHDGWPDSALDIVPDRVTAEVLGGRVDGQQSDDDQGDDV
jgi:7-cyano-7-deazaguanine tRNA-ribosyltransferase